MTTDRGTAWSVTINNPVAADEENIALSRQRGWTVDGQLEKGENGTPHYQLIVKTPQTRFSTVKKAFPRAHIELARKAVALEKYVHKKETKQGELAIQTELYPSLQRTWDMWAEWDPYARLKLKPAGSKMTEADQFLELFDEFVHDKIKEGYVLETMAVNPQIRSCVKSFYKSIIFRSNIRRQTDRQTDENNVAVEEHNNATQESYQEASLPQA